MTVENADSSKTAKKRKAEEEGVVKKKAKTSGYDCKVSCLDGTGISILNVPKSSKGEILFDKVVQELSITQKEYMGLTFINEASTKCWLDIHKEMKHQIGDAESNFDLRVKFYEPEPARIKDEYTRYLLYLQLRDDLVTGRFETNQMTYTMLGSYTAQAELGDFNLSEHEPNYLEKYQFSPNDDDAMRERINDLHKDHHGQSPAQAELNFLEICKKLHRYGVEVHVAEDSQGPVDIGVAALGINIYRDGKREKMIPWQNLDVLTYKKRKFNVKLRESAATPAENNKKGQRSQSYTFDTARKCKECYKTCVEYHTFFRLTRPDSPRKTADNLKPGSSFRYSDKTLYQLRQRNSNGNGAEPVFTRKPSTKDMRKKQLDEESESEDDEDDGDVLMEDDRDESDEKGAPAQFEEADVDEENPNDGNFDPKEWEILEKTLPDGTKKRIRRRKIPVKKYHDVVKPDGTQLSPDCPIMTEKIPIQYEDVALDESNPETFNYDPEEWQKVDKVYSNGDVKHVRRKVFVVKEKKFVVTPEGEKQEVYDNLPIHEEESTKYEEVEMDKKKPETMKFDPKEWEVFEKPDGKKKKKKFRRRDAGVDKDRYVIRPDGTKEKVVDDFPTIVQKFPEDLQEVEIDKSNPISQTFNPKEWEVVEQTFPDGSKKTVRRPIKSKASKPDLVLVEPEKSDGTPGEKTVLSPETPVVSVEEIPVALEETDGKGDEMEICDPVNEGTQRPLSDKILKQVKTVKAIKPTVGKVVPDVLTEEVQEPCDEEPIQFEEVVMDENEPQAMEFNPADWEVVERKLPDGKKKKICRRKVPVKKDHVVTCLDGTSKQLNPDCPVLVEQIPIQYEDVALDESNPETFNYDPEEWQKVDKVYPNGDVKHVRRKVFVVKEKKFVVTPEGEKQEVYDNLPIYEEESTKYEEVEMDKKKPETMKFDPKEWEVFEKPDGKKKKKKFRRRVAGVDKDRYVIRPDGTKEKVVDDFPTVVQKFPEDQEVEIDKSDPVSQTFNPKEWEVVEQTFPDGSKKTVRRPIKSKASKPDLVLVEPEKSDGTPGDKTVLSPETPVVSVEEIPVALEETDVKGDPMDISDPVNEDTQRNYPGDRPKTKHLKTVKAIKPTAAKVIPDVLTEEVQVPCDEEPIQFEEVVMDENEPQSMEFNPADWEVVERKLPDGKKKKIRRRKVPVKKDHVVTCPDGTSKQLSPDCPVLFEQIPIQYENVALDESNPETFNYDPEEWQKVDKVYPNGDVKHVRRKVFVVKEKKFVVTPEGEKQEVYDNLPIHEESTKYEEVEMDKKKPETMKFDPKEWEVFEKPDGKKKKKFRRRVAGVDKDRYVIRPDGTKEKVVDDFPTIVQKFPEDLQEVEIDKSNPVSQTFNPKEWEVVEQTFPDGSKKTVRRPIKSKASKPDLVLVEPEKSDGTPGEKTVLSPETPVVSVEEIPVALEETDGKGDEMEICDPVNEGTQRPLSDKIPKQVKTVKAIKPTVGKVVPDVLTEEVQEPCDEEPIQFEEVVMDENEPQSMEFNPADWEVVERKLPDGKKKKIRRRKVPVKKDHVVTCLDGTSKQLSPDCPFLVEQIPIQYEDVALNESNPETFNYDPEEWQKVDKVYPDGDVKHVRRKVFVVKEKKFVVMPEGEKQEVYDNLPIHEEESTKYEEVEMDKKKPETMKFDPKEWEVFEKPDGKKKKKFRRRVAGVDKDRYVIRPDGTKEKVVDDFPTIVQKFPEDLQEVEIDKSNPVSQTFNPKEWEVVEQTFPDGSKKTVRRPIKSKASKPDLVLVEPEKSDGTPGDKTVLSPETPVVSVEEIPVALEETDVKGDPMDISDPVNEDTQRNYPGDRPKTKHLKTVKAIKPTAAKVIPDVLTEEVQVPCDEEPIQFEEVVMDENEPQSMEFNPADWEVVERKLPDGKKKKIRRRKVPVKKDHVVTCPDGTSKQLSPDCPVLVEQIPIQYEDVALDESNPETFNYDPEEWQKVDKVYPNGDVKHVRRKVFVVKEKKFVVTPEGEKQEVYDNLPIYEEESTKYEEVEMDKKKPETMKFDPKEWEVFEKPDGKKKKKKFRRRVAGVDKDRYVIRPDGTKEKVVDDFPTVVQKFPEDQEVEIDKSDPVSQTFNPKEWEVVEQTFPDGSKKTVRRPIKSKASKPDLVLVEPEKSDGTPGDKTVLSPETPVVSVEEIPVALEETDVKGDPMDISDPVNEDTQRNYPGDRPKTKHLKTVKAIKPTAAKVIPDVLTEEVQVPCDEEPIQFEEVVMDENEPQSMEFNPADWEVVERKLPDGKKKKIRRRKVPVKKDHVVTCPDGTSKQLSPDCPVLVEQIPIQYEDVALDESNPETFNYDPEEWQKVDKVYPNGDVKHVRRKVFVVKEKKFVVTPEGEKQEVYDNLPIYEEESTKYEEVEMDKKKPETMKFDPKEWEVFEKPDGKKKKKKFRRRVAGVDKDRYVIRPDGTKEKVVDDFPTVVQKFPEDQEVEIDKSDPVSQTFNPKEWEVVEQTFPDGSKKTVRRPIKSKASKPDLVLVEPEKSDGTPGDKTVLSPETPVVSVEEIPVALEETDVKGDPMDISDPVNEDTQRNYPGDRPKTKHLKTVKAIKPTAAKVIPDVLTEEVQVPCDEEPIQFEEVVMDENEPQSMEFNPADWEVVERKLPDGKKKKIRRRKVPVKKDHVVTCPDGTSKQLSPDCPVLVEQIPIQYEDVALDESNPETFNYDPEEWQKVDKVYPNGDVKHVRRKVFVVKEKKFLVTPEGEKQEVYDNLPIHEEESTKYEEVEMDKKKPETMKFDPKEWEVFEKPDGKKKKKFRRRVAGVDKDRYVIRPDGTKEKVVDDFPTIVQKFPEDLQEVEIDKSNPVSQTFNPKEWEVVEQTFPDGSKKTVRRPIKSKASKPDLVLVEPEKSDGTPGEKTVLPPETPVVSVEEIPVALEETDVKGDEMDICDSEGLQNGLKTAKTIKLMPSSTVPNVLTEDALKPFDEALNEDQPFLLDIDFNPVVETDAPKYEEVILDENVPESMNYDPEEWEVIEKQMPDGTKKKVRRRIFVITTVKTSQFKPLEAKDDDVVVEDVPKYEVVVLDESVPETMNYDPKEWEVIEKQMPDGTKKKVRRRIFVITTVKTSQFKPLEAKDDNVVVEDAPKYEEVILDECVPETMNYDPKEWEVLEKEMPDGTKKKVRRRIIVVKTIKLAKVEEPQDSEEEEDEDNGPVLVEEGPLQYEEVDMDEESPDDLDPMEWENVEKTLPDGTKRKTKRRMITVKTITTKRIITAPDGTEQEDVQINPPQLVEEIPVEYEEFPVDESCPDEYDPKDWEIVDKLVADMQVKTRRRIVVKPINKIRFLVHADGTKEMVTPDSLMEEGPLLFHVYPHDEQKPLHPNEEIFEKTSPEGTRIRIRRRFVPTKQVKTFRIFIRADGTREEETLCNNAPVIEEELPVKCEEVSVDESEPIPDTDEWQIIELPSTDGRKKKIKRRVVPVVSKAKVFLIRSDGTREEVCDDESEPAEDQDEYEEIEMNELDPESMIFDPEEWLVEERLQPDGTTKKVRRRLITPAKKLDSIKDQPDGKGKDEIPVHVEEVDIDENDPESMNFDPSEWQIEERILPDGTTKRVRRRVIVIKSLRSFETKMFIVRPDGTQDEIIDQDSPVIIEEVPEQYEEIELNHEIPESMEYDPKEWEIVERMEPNGTKIRVRRRPLLKFSSRPKTTPIDEKNINSSMEDILSDISDLSRSLVDDESFTTTSLERRPKHPKKNRHSTSKELEEEELKRQREEEEKKWDEGRKALIAEDEKIREANAATLSSIFTLPDIDDIEPLKHRYSTFDDDSDKPNLTSEPDKIDLATNNEPKASASLGREKKVPPPVFARKSSGSEQPRRYTSSRSVTLPSTGSSQDSDDERKLSIGSLQSDRRLSSNSGADQSDYRRPHEGGPNREVIYTVTDVSNVEQGVGGFVRAVKEKHEVIANEEKEARRLSHIFPTEHVRIQLDTTLTEQEHPTTHEDTPTKHDHTSSKHERTPTKPERTPTKSERTPTKPETLPKGHVPTVHTSFQEPSNEVFRTTSPPVIATKPTVIRPLSTEFPDEEVILPVRQVTEESHPDVEFIEPVQLPEVETEPMVFHEPDDQLKSTPVADCVIETTPVLISEETTTEETIHNPDGSIQVFTHILPTEVITKTIVVEGDSSSLTPQEMQMLFDKDHDSKNVSSTQVTTTVQKVITGQTITVTGDASEEEIQQIVKNAIAEANEGGDGNEAVVVTAVQSFEEEVTEDSETEI